MRRRLKVRLLYNFLEIKKEKKSTNFLMLHNLDPNIGKREVEQQPGKRKIKTKAYKEDE
jgi:hypothetical protein